MLCGFMRVRTLTIALAAGALLLPVSVIAENEADAIETFNDWSAFLEGDSCWIASQIDIGVGIGDEEALFYVAFHKGALAPEILLYSVSTAKIEFVILRIEGIPYKFTAIDDAAFATSGDEMRILKALSAGFDPRILYRLEGSSEVLGRVSKDGFDDAYNFIRRSCGSKFMPDLSNPA